MAGTIKGQHVSNTPRLKPPPSLSIAARAVFEHLVNAVDPAHFCAADMPLLETYATHAAIASEAAERISVEGALINDKPNAWLSVFEKSTKQLVALSARLRVCPQSRFDRLVAGSNSRSQFDEMQIPEHIRSLLA